MAYYSERNGLRSSIVKTYDISIDVYGLLIECCESYFDNLAWKYPAMCPDGHGCCGLDYQKFSRNMQFEIPDLFRDDSGRIACPSVKHNVFDEDDSVDDYNQFALLDYIEFFAENCRDIVIGEYHSYFGHHHITCKTTNEVFRDFKERINRIFEKTGIQYVLNDTFQIERVVDNTVLTPKMQASVVSVKEARTRELLNEAITLHRSPRPNDIRDATEKIWDAFERLKTYYTIMDKKASASKIVTDMSSNSPDYATLFETEFKALTTIGNTYRIRHHETDKIEITDTRYYDYFFNRCLSLIAIAIQYLQ